MIASVAIPVHAQEPDDLKRGVARISLMNGEVSVRRGDSGEWVAGVINAPLLADDRISTGPNSRAEVQFDASNFLRIGGNAEVRLAALEYGRYQLEVAHGTMTYRVLRPTDANVEVDTPSVSVRPAKVGVYRISVNEAGETEVICRAGDVEVFTPRGSQILNANQMMVARGTSSDPEFQIVGATPYDEWDRWSDSRDQVFTQSTSYQYVDPSTSGVYGTEALDNYGTWTDVPNYGYCWRPTVAVGWAPYRQGRWAWEDWYGWTWVSYDPWGWAPYHYGRWFHEDRYGWMWYPGVRGVRHYWSPALVAFFGYGGGGGIGFGFGNVGWVPLAPYEVFHPWWGRGYYGGRNYNNRNINITNVNITNAYRNARVGNGISAVNAGDFRSGRFNNVTRVSGEQVRTAGLVRGQMPIGPSSAHMNFTDRRPSFTPRTNENTRFFTRQQAAGPQRGQTFGQGNRGSVAPQISRPSQTPAQNGGNRWQHFGEPAAQGAAAPQAQAPRNQGNAWGGNRSPMMENNRPSQQAPSSNGARRFGDPGTNSRQYSAPADNGQGRQFGRSAPSYSAPQQSAPRYSAPPQQRYSAPQQSAPRYSAPPQQRYSAPQQSAPRYSAPSYSAPRSAPAPSYSAPRGNSGGGGNGGGARSSGGNAGGGGSHGGHGRR